MSEGGVGQGRGLVLFGHGRLVTKWVLSIFWKRRFFSKSKWERWARGGREGGLCLSKWVFEGKVLTKWDIVWRWEVCFCRYNSNKQQYRVGDVNKWRHQLLEGRRNDAETVANIKYWHTGGSSLFAVLLFAVLTIHIQFLRNLTAAKSGRNL